MVISCGFGIPVHGEWRRFGTMVSTRFLLLSISLPSTMHSCKTTPGHLLMQFLWPMC